MTASTWARRTVAGAAALAGAAVLLSGCGLTSPNSSSSSKDRTTTTAKKTLSTSFPTVAYVPTTTTSTTILASAGAGAGNGQPSGPVDTPTSYVVKSGDIAVLIARKFSITLSELAAANPDKNMDRLVVGDQLTIPPPNPGSNPTPTIPPPNATTRPTTAGSTTTVVKSGATYTVQAGDTLVGIAKKLGISVTTLQQLNPGLSSNLQVGQKINIPKGTGGAAAQTTTTKKP